MISKRSVLACSVALASATMTSIATASEHMEEVNVVGQYLSLEKVNSVKTPTPIIDVPQSLSIFTADQIDQQGIRSVGQIIDYTAGVNTSQGEGHRDAIVFRGVRSTADFYIDGARDDVQYYRGLYNIEQIEILRGPNALLFGRGGTGGVLNRVTKKAQIGDSFTAYKASVDTFEAHSFEIDSNIAINDTAALRINAHYDTLSNHRDFYDGERYGINPTLHVEVSPNTSLDVSYEYVDHKRFIDRGIPTGADGEPERALDNITFGDSDLNRNDLEAHLLRAALSHQFSDYLKGNFSAFYGDYSKSYQNFYASDYDPQDNPNIVELDGYVDTTERENLILSGNLIGEFNTGEIEHTVLFGVEYIKTSSDQDRYNAVWSTNGDDQEWFVISDHILNGGSGLSFDRDTGTTRIATNSFTDLNDDTRVDIEVSSVYFQDQIAFAPWLDVVLGARFDSFDIDVDNLLQTDPDARHRSRRDDEVSPRAGIIFKPQENISVYFSYSESFLPRSGEQFANINGDANDLDPDEFENKEVGVKWDIGQRLSLTAAYFESEQTIAARDNDTGESFDVRGLEVDGFELQLRGQVTESFSFYSSYSYFDGETGNDEEPRELPENMFSFWGNYLATDKLGFGLGVTYQDESLINDGGAQTLPDYTRVDAAVFYDVSDNLRVQLNLENLTDEDYYPNAHSTHQASVGAPFNALLSVSGSF